MMNSGGRILYIDDDPHIVRLAQRAFARGGVTVVHVEDVHAGRALLQTDHFDAIILDHHLKLGTGIAFLRSLSEDPVHIPVVYVTGSNDPQVAVEALKAGAADYVMKAVGDEFMPLLRNAVEQAIEKTALLRAKERAEIEVRIARDRAEALLTEVNHRVSNSLALAGALIRLQASRAQSEEVRVALTETQARINAIGSIHRSLYTSSDVTMVDVGAYLGTLLAELSQSLNGVQEKLAIETLLQPIKVTTDRAVSIGVIVTELVTNAFKYAYGPEGGSVRVEFVRYGDGHAVLAVEDSGIGWPGEGETRGTGIGTKVIRSMASTLGADVRFILRNPGTRAELRLQLPPDA